jgi:hypothetical protein
MPTAKPRSRRDQQSKKEFFDQLAIKWNIQKPEDWNKVTNKMALQEGGSSVTSLRQGNIIG